MHCASVLMDPEVCCASYTTTNIYRIQITILQKNTTIRYISTQTLRFCLSAAVRCFTEPQLTSPKSKSGVFHCSARAHTHTHTRAHTHLLHCDDIWECAGVEFLSTDVVLFFPPEHNVLLQASYFTDQIMNHCHLVK